MIDLNRGVTMRPHASGVKVCMYKDTPGVYFAQTGVEVSEKMAKEAGFPVDKLYKERLRRDRVSEAMEKINQEFGHVAEGKVIQAFDGFQVVHAADGLFHVVDPDGNTLTDSPVMRGPATKLAKSLAKQEAPNENEGEQDGTTA